jgi:tetratricopeptide (TPR) repeat protein
MDRVLTRNALWIILGALAWPWVGVAEDFVAEPSANPFVPVTLERESLGRSMRHPLHKFRTTWDRYFQTWPKPREDHEATTLAQLRGSPRAYLQRKVQFDVWLNERGAFYRPYVAHFFPDHHFNFSAWAYGSEIWVKDQRVDVFPFLYVDLINEKVVREIQAMPRYAGVRLWGEVKIVNEGYPWIQVNDAEALEEPRLTQSSLRALEQAYARMDQRDWGLAADGLRMAMREPLPMVIAMKVNEALGKCLMEQGRCASAREMLIGGLALYGTPRVQLPGVLRKDSRCVRSLLLLAECALKLDRDAEAQAASEIVVELEPSNALAHVLLGMARAKQGDVRGGLAEVDAGQRLVPEGRFLEARRYRARIYALQGQWDAAKAELDQALLLRANDPDLRLELGDVLLAQRNPTAALKEFEFGANLAPDRAEPYLKLATGYRALGEAALAEKKRDEAANAFALALEKVKICCQRDDQYAPAYAFHADMMRMLGKNAEAAAVLAQAAKVGSQSLSMQEMLLEQAKAQGDWDGMEKACARAVELHPEHAPFHVRLADIRIHRPSPDFAGAEAEYAVATQLAPDDVDAWGRLAYVRNKLGLWTQAAQAAQQAVALDPNNYRGWSELTTSRRQLGDYSKAVEAARKAFALQNTVASRTNLAAAYLDRGNSADVQEALALAKLAASDAQSPVEVTTAQSVLGAALVMSGNSESARASFQAADTMMGQDPWHNLWYGRCLARLGDGPGAVAKLDKALGQATPGASKLMDRIRKEAVREMKEAEKLPAPARTEPPANLPPVIQTETPAPPVVVPPAP